MTIVVDGNDGTGKSTLVASLRRKGFRVSDRGVPTKLTVDDHTEAPSKEDAYVILTAPIEVSRARLAQAGKDLAEEWHTVESLTFFANKFQEVGARLGAHFIDSSGSIEETERAALSALNIPAERPIRVGVPKGRLQKAVLDVLDEHEIFMPYPKGSLLLNSAPWVEAVLLKPRSIPELVLTGALDIGFTGLDLAVDEGCAGDDLKFSPLKGGSAVDLRVLSTPRWSVGSHPVRIATEFPRIASNWASSRGMPHMIVRSYGSTEAFVPRFADMAIDVVETGATAGANGLTPGEVVLTSFPVAIVRSGSGLIHHRMFQ